MFKGELTFYSSFNVKELFVQKRREIWSLSAYNGSRTHNHVAGKRLVNHLDNLAKWLRCVVSTDLYGAFDCMFLSYHVRISEWIHTM